MTTEAIRSDAAAPGAEYAATASTAYRAALDIIESVEPRIAAAIGLREDVKRVPLFGLGCVAGAAGVARAAAQGEGGSR
jgi:predicted naringenin-chalcone synthase